MAKSAGPVTKLRVSEPSKPNQRKHAYFTTTMVLSDAGNSSKTSCLEQQNLKRLRSCHHARAIIREGVGVQNQDEAGQDVPERRHQARGSRRSIRCATLQLSNPGFTVLDEPPERSYGVGQCRLCDFLEFLEPIVDFVVSLFSRFHHDMVVSLEMERENDVRILFLILLQKIMRDRRDECASEQQKGYQITGPPQWLPDYMRDNSCYTCPKQHPTTVGTAEALWNFYLRGLRLRFDRDYDNDDYEIRFEFRDNYSFSVKGRNPIVWPVQWTVGMPTRVTVFAPPAKTAYEVLRDHCQIITNYQKHCLHVLIYSDVSMSNRLCKLIVGWARPPQRELKLLEILLY